MTSRDCFVQMLFTVKVILCNVCSSQLTCGCSNYMHCHSFYDYYNCCHSDSSGSVLQKAVKTQVCANATQALSLHDCQ